MPRRSVPDHPDVPYYLVLFDENGDERPGRDGRLISEEVTESAAEVTDIFFLSHGWMGDIPAAIKQYDRWIAAMADQTVDRQRIRETVAGFAAMVVGVHWPSRPWGEEDTGAAVLGGDSPVEDFESEAMLTDAELVDRYAPRIADTASTRDALGAVLAAAKDPRIAEMLETGQLSDYLVAAYRTLLEQAQIETGGVLAPPGSDQAVFDPGRTVQEWTSVTGDGAPAPQLPASGGPGLLGLTGDLAERFWKVKNALLMPVRQLSFWQMKRRARLVGESGVHQLLDQLQSAAPHARLHLMGHSFGCIVVTAAIAGPIVNGRLTAKLRRPVDSVFLAQGAMSLWSYADAVPFPPRAPGYYRVLRETPRLIKGPLVTTRSTFDRAVGTFYPLGAQIAGDVVLGVDGLPEFGAIGAFGIQGTVTNDGEVLAPDGEYGFLPEQLYNIDASRVIRNGIGPAGAHNDISHPEIAHLMWQAVAATPTAPDDRE